MRSIILIKDYYKLKTLILALVEHNRDQLLAFQEFHHLFWQFVLQGMDPLMQSQGLCLLVRVEHRFYLCRPFLIVFVESFSEIKVN
uniref:Uncharacterized protein n=1 Tax=Panagrolaimus superbus TaxID=310955 RepID=A0A914Z8N7_9BILA